MKFWLGALAVILGSWALVAACGLLVYWLIVVLHVPVLLVMFAAALVSCIGVAAMFWDDV